jgi:hypothetical protein
MSEPTGWAKYGLFAILLTLFRLAIALRIRSDSADMTGLVLFSLTVAYVAVLLNLYLLSRFLKAPVGLAIASGVAATPWIVVNMRSFQWTVPGVTGPAIDILLWVVLAWCAAVVAFWHGETVVRPKQPEATHHMVSES